MKCISVEHKRKWTVSKDEAAPEADEKNTWVYVIKNEGDGSKHKIDSPKPLGIEPGEVLTPESIAKAQRDAIGHAGSM